MFSSPIEEIKNRLDIVEVVGSYIKLQKAGANYRALCPFHSEKRPSFFVSPARQIWHCFGGCSEGGDIFKFVMKIEGVEFGDALRILAQKAGVELRRQDPKLKTERRRLYEICELATRFFEKQLEDSKTGKQVKDYLLGRGIKEESIKKWRIGYAPDVWQGLSGFLDSRGYQKEEIEKAGLALSSEKGSFYDRFRGRIIFPVFDLNSQVIGFGGRVFGEKREAKEVAKYVNTPQTLLYDKGRTLYGLDKAKLDIRKQDSCILVEGYIDLIMASQAGFPHVVATSGTALTPFQLAILKRYSNNLLTAFDMDPAGDMATKRGIDLAQSQGFSLKVVTLPQGLDPAATILEQPEEWERQVKEAKSILDFYFDTTFAKFDKEKPEGKEAISKVLLPVIKRIPNRIIQSHWVGELARKLEAKEVDVEEELKKVKVEEGVVYPEPEEAKPSPRCRKDLLEERLAVLVIKYPKNKEYISQERLDNCSFPVKEILTKLKEGVDLEKEQLSPQLLDCFNRLALQAEIEEMEEEAVLPEIQHCLKELQSLEIRDKLNKLAKEIKKAEEEKDTETLKKLIQDFNLCSKSLGDSEIT